MIAPTNINVKAISIPSDDPFTQYSLLSHKRDSSTDNAIATNTQVQAVFQAKSVAVARHLRDREAMEDRCFCEAAASEIAVTTARHVSHTVKIRQELAYGAYCITKKLPGRLASSPSKVAVVCVFSVLAASLRESSRLS